MDGTDFNNSLKTCRISSGERAAQQHHTPSKGHVLSRVNQINTRTQHEQFSSSKLSLTPVVPQRQRSGSFTGPAWRPSPFRCRPRLTKYSSLSSLSTTTSRPSDLGFGLDGEAGDVACSSGLPLGKRDLTFTAKGKKLPELSSYTSSKLASTLGRALHNTAQCASLPRSKPSNSCQELSTHYISSPFPTFRNLGTGDGVREDFKGHEPLHHCHFCRESMRSKDPCSNCGHEFCPQCIEDEISSEVPSTKQSVPKSQGLSRAWSPKHTFPDVVILPDDHLSIGNTKPQSDYFPGQLDRRNEYSPASDFESSPGPSSEQQSSTVMARRRPPIRTAKSTPTLTSRKFTESVVTSSGDFEEELEPSTNSVRSPPHHAMSLNGSCSTSDQVTHHGPRHCFCCAARRPQSSQRATQSAVAESRSIEIPTEKVLDGIPDYSLPSPSDRSTSTLLKSLGDVDLYPPALQPHRQDSTAPSITSAKTVSLFGKTSNDNAMPLTHSHDDPYEGYRRLQPHPHPPEPETEPWPRLRKVTRPISKRLEVPSEPIPWRRSALRKVPISQPPTPIKESLPSLEQHEQLEGADNLPESLFSSPPHTPNTKPGRRRVTRTFFDRNRSESSKRGGLSVAHSAREPSYSSRGSGVSPRQIDSYQISRASPQLSLQQVEKMLAQGAGQNEPYSMGNDQGDASNPDIKQSNPTLAEPVSRSPTRHSCGWKDRFMDLSAEVDQLRTELASPEGISSDTDLARAAATQAKPRQSNLNNSDTGIEGITIIIHLRGKDDLVINTDLRNDQYYNQE